MTSDPSDRSGSGSTDRDPQPSRQDPAALERLDRERRDRERDRIVTREATQRGGQRNRYWAVAVIAALGIAAAYYGFTVAEIRAADGGADPGTATGAAAVIGVASLLAVVAAGSLLMALLVRGRRATTVGVVVGSALALVVAAVLVLWIHPMVLGG